MRGLGLSLAIIVSLSGTAYAQTSCAGAQTPRQVAELLFGRSNGERAVSEAAWARFLATEVTPRFPDGLTVTDAKGQWRDPKGVIIRERSKVLMIVLPGNADDQSNIEAVVAAYKTRFRQQSVGVIVRNACVSF